MSGITEKQRATLMSDLLKLALRHHNDGKVRGLLDVPTILPASEGPVHRPKNLLEDITCALQILGDAENEDGATKATVEEITAPGSGSQPPPVARRIRSMEQQLFDRREERRIISHTDVTITESDSADDDNIDDKSKGGFSQGSPVATGPPGTLLRAVSSLSRRSYDENAYRNEEFFRTTSISPHALDNVGTFVVHKERERHRHKIEKIRDDITQEAIQLWDATMEDRRVKRRNVRAIPDEAAPSTTPTNGGGMARSSESPPASRPTMSKAQRAWVEQEEDDAKAVEELMWDPTTAEIAPMVPTAHAARVREAMLVQGYDPPEQVTIGLLTGPVMHKPQGIDEKSAALKHQGYYCKGCLKSLKKSANPLRGWDAAVFCSYTGYYFCEECNDRSQLSVIPARVVRDWDFSEHMVSSLAHTFLDIHRCQTPMLCISAVNPALYDQVWLLRTVRELRVELVALNNVGIHCKQFRKRFYSYGGAALVPTNRSGDRRDTSGPRSSTMVSYRSRANSTLSDTGFMTNRRMSLLSGMHLGLGTRSGDYADGKSANRNDEETMLFDTDNDAYIPVYKRYLVMDSECWTLEDLEDLHQADPENLGPELIKRYEEQRLRELQLAESKAKRRMKKGDGTGISSKNNAPMTSRVNNPDHHPLTAFTSISPLIEELLNVRRWFLRHILKECVDQCLPAAVHSCRSCRQHKGKDLIMSILPTASRCFHHCPQCKSYFHKACWKRLETEAKAFASKEEGEDTVVMCPECRKDAARAARIEMSKTLW